jgi:sortase (surface protein transpeptidase)
MARYVPKHRKKRRLLDRRLGSFAAVVLAGVASFSGSFGYVPGALAIDPANPFQSPTISVPLAQASVEGSEVDRLVAAPSVVPAIDTAKTATPTYFSIPSIGAGGELIELGLETDGTLEVPVDFYRVGWYRGSSRPGDAGPAVLAGHVDSQVGGAGIFKKLHLLKPGDEVGVALRDGSKLSYTVTRVDRYLKSTFPTALVYGDTADSELRLITCGGKFDRKSASYESNVVVYAKLLSRS